MTNISGRKWYSVNPLKVVNILIILITCILGIVFLPYMIKMAMFLVAIALMTGYTDMPIIMFYCALTVVALVVTYYVSHKQSIGEKALRLVGVLIVSVVFATVTSGLSLTIYKEYRVISTTPKMEESLENRYKEDFVVIEPKNCRTTKWGPETSVCATAYSKKNPSYRFSIQEDYRGTYSDTYKDR